MKKVTIFLLFFPFCSILFAQSTYDISKYYYPAINRSQLDFRLKGNSAADVGSSEGTGTFTAESKSDNFAANGETSIAYDNYTNTRKKVSTLFLGTTINGSYKQGYSETTHYNIADRSRSYTNTSDKSNVTSHTGISASWRNNHYLSPKLYAIYDIEGSFGYDYAKNTQNSYFVKNNEKSYFLSSAIGAGYGRIERVEDARQAVYIMDALDEKGQLNRNLNEDEVFELSQLISRVKNKRFLDARIRQIEEITTIDDFLHSKDVLSGNGIPYFTTLYDMWQYGALYERKSGRQIAFRYNPYYSASHHKRTSSLPADNAVDSTESKRYNLELRYNFERPFKLNWQHSVDMGAGVYHKLIADEKTPTYTNMWLNYTLGFFPTTRTNLNITFFQNYRHQNNLENDVSKNYETGLRGTVSYYISPQLRVSGDMNAAYIFYRHHEGSAYSYKSGTLTTACSVNFSYFIF